MKRTVKNGAGQVALLLAAALGLVACGSDHDSDSPAAAPPPVAGVPPTGAVPPEAVPASAGASVAAYLAYLRQLRTDETSSPVLVGGFVPPVDDVSAATPLGS
jgi:hypothetical protein